MNTTAQNKTECDSLPFILSELSKVTKELDIQNLDVDPDFESLDSIPKFLSLAKRFNIDVGNVYLMSYRMHYFRDYSRGGVNRSTFNANLNGVFDFNRKVHRESQCDVYLDSGEQHWMTSRPCYAGKKFEINREGFLEKLDLNLIKLMNSSSEILIVDLKSKKYLMHSTEENTAIKNLFEEKFPLSKINRQQVNVSETSLILNCIKTLGLKNIHLDKARVHFDKNFKFDEAIGLTRYIPFTFYCLTPDTDTQPAEKMLLDLDELSVLTFQDVISNWLDGNTCEYELNRWLTIRHIAQLNERERTTE